MKKIIGYGASLLVLAAAGGLFFSASTAEAGGTQPGGGMNNCPEKLSGLCACVQDVVGSIVLPPGQGGTPPGQGGTPPGQGPNLADVKAALEDCLHDFCPAQQPCDVK
jgi:hypothetical protein